MTWLDELRQNDWTKIDLRIALSCPLAVALCLLGGFLLNEPIPAMIAAGGAFTVGFGARQSLSEWRVLPMLACLIGIAVSAYIGSMVGTSLLWTLVTASLSAILTGIAASRNSSLGWVVLQGTIALVIAASFPGDEAAIERASWLLLGGSLQIFIFILALLFRWDKNWQPSPQPQPAHAFVLALKYMLIAVGGIMLERGLSLPNGFWIPMTALIVARPTVSPSLVLILQRIGGTLVGAIGASFISTFTTGHTDLVLIAATTFFAALSYACLQLNYGIFSASLTAYISLLLSIHGPPETQIVEARALATILGCALALIISLPLAYATRRWMRRHAVPETSLPAVDSTISTSNDPSPQPRSDGRSENPQKPS